MSDWDVHSLSRIIWDKLRYQTFRALHSMQNIGAIVTHGEPFSGPSKQVLHGVYPFRPRRFSFQISRKHVSSSNANSHLRGHQIWAPNFQDLAHGTVARTYIILYRRYTTSLQQPLTALTALDWQMWSQAWDYMATTPAQSPEHFQSWANDS